MTLPCMTCTLNVYDRDGVTLRGSLAGKGVQVTIEAGLEGGAQLTGSMWETALRNNPALFRDGIVKVATDFGNGEVEFAAFLTQAGSGTLIGDELAARELSPAGRGLLALYGDARLAHEKRWAVTDLGEESTRYFGPMWEWFDDSAWNAAQGTVWYDMAGRRAGWPPQMLDIDKTAQWVAATDPNASQPEGAVHWFRKRFTLTAKTPVKAWFTGDNFARVWLDAEQIGDLRSDPSGWRGLAEWSGTLPAGTYTLAARVENAPATTGANPMAFLLTLWSLDARGEPKTLIVHTDTTWKATAGAVGMTVGHILRRLRSEAFDRGLVAVSRLLPTFTNTHDTAGVAWPVDEERSWPIGESMLAIITELAETSADIEATPSLQLNAWVSRGRSLPGVALVAGHNIVSYTYDTEPLTGTRVVVKTEEGYVVETDAAAESAHDPREDYFDAGGAPTREAGRKVARRHLDDSARDRIVYTAVVVAMPARDGHASCIPFVDFTVGDTITGLDVNLAPAPLTVTAISGSFPDSGGPWQWTLELEEP